MSEHNDTEDTYSDIQTWNKGEDLKEGSHIDRYQILGLLGKGGMGAVYKAYDPELDRSIAIKILTVKPQEGETASRPQARLMREAQALAKLNHPNVVAVHDVGTFEDGVYIAMEYVKGKTLREWLKYNQPTQKEILGALFEAGRGLQAAHTEGLVHRDFKPDNVLIGDKGQVKVLDFGLARAAGITETEIPKENPASKHENTLGEKLLYKTLTRFGSMVGTIVYMAPEHFQFEEIDEKTDQFSFCVTLFEAMYGKRPFHGKTADELEKNITNGRIEIPQEAPVPKWIEHIIVKGLSTSKDIRFQSMAQVLDALQDDPEIAKKTKRKRIAMTSMLFILTSMTIGFGYYALFKSSKICTGADRKVAGVWSDESKEKVRQAFARTELNYSKDSYVRTTKRLDDYLAKWAKEYTNTCEATRVRGEQSDEVMDLKMECLQIHLKNANALVRVLSEADKIVVSKSIQAVSTLSDFANCKDVKVLQSRIPLPKDEQTKKKVADIREKLSEVEALSRTGKYREGLERVRKIGTDAKAVDYRPLIAEVLYELGSLLSKNGEYKKAETTLYDAAEAAGNSRDGLLVAKAMALLSRIVGEKQARNDVGLSIARDAELMLLVAGGNLTIRFELLNTLGVLFYRKGCYDEALEYLHKSLTIRENTLGNESYYLASSFGNMGLVFAEQDNYDKAIEYYRKALVIHQKVLGPKHPDVATSLNNLGLVLTDQGDYEKALEYHSKALAIKEKALGPNHPRVAKSLNNLGLVLQKVGEHKRALEHYRKTLAIEEKVLGIEHSNLAWSLSDIGSVFLEQERPKQAIAPLERVVRLCKKKNCDPEPHGSSLLDLAQALILAGGDNARATKLAKQSLGILGKNPKRFTKELKEVNAWLEKHSKEKPTATR